MVTGAGICDELLLASAIGCVKGCAKHLASPRMRPGKPPTSIVLASDPQFHFSSAFPRKWAVVPVPEIPAFDKLH